ncbi:MAG TPA: cation-translocating P-type ATPase C-terminal domain-containing protein, partial [Bdellovibrionales bacterium]|nr:cation-translocating P-type ATPase C-terminal domain-containing protein [Bdellovibrionales bacterium]
LATMDEGSARSLAFTTLVLSQLFRAFAARSQTRVFWEVGALSNLWLLIVIAVTGALQLSLHYIPLAETIFELHPLTLQELLTILPWALVTVTLIEVRKLLMRARSARAH